MVESVEWMGERFDGGFSVDDFGSLFSDDFLFQAHTYTHNNFLMIIILYNVFLFSALFPAV